MSYSKHPPLKMYPPPHHRCKSVIRPIKNLFTFCSIQTISWILLQHKSNSESVCTQNYFNHILFPVNWAFYRLTALLSACEFPLFSPSQLWQSTVRYVMQASPSCCGRLQSATIKWPLHFCNITGRERESLALTGTQITAAQRVFLLV